MGMDARGVSSLQSGRGQAAGPTCSVPEARASGVLLGLRPLPKKNGANTRRRQPYPATRQAGGLSPAAHEKKRKEKARKEILRESALFRDIL